jgi:thioredoxin reductase (NADPH)
MAENKTWDLAIIGMGPAGLSASIYASRFGIKHSLIGLMPGGMISESYKVDNYLGVENLSGLELAQKMLAHAQKYAPELIASEVVEIKKRKDQNIFEINILNQPTITARAVVLATGTKYRQLNIPGEKELLGKGISYCATCDGFFYKNKVTAAIGGGNSAVSAAVHLAQIAKQVFLIHRNSELSVEDYWIKMLKENQKITVISNTNVLEILGQKKVEKIKLDRAFHGQLEISVDGIFVEVGSDPSLEFARGLGLLVDAAGYLKINAEGATNVAGIWAAGDITTGSNKFRQAIIAAAEGAVAIQNVFNYLKKK